MNNIVTIIIPIFNEMKNSFFHTNIESFKRHSHFSYIFVDGGSTDGTVDYLKSFSFNILNETGKSRGSCLSLGLKNCQTPIAVLHHPRSILDPSALYHLQKEGRSYSWGGFIHEFDKSHPLLKFTSWYSNNIRAKIREIYYLDHCIFINLEKFKNNEFLNVNHEVFEDTVLSLKLRGTRSSTLLPYRSTTSAIRFEKNGYFFQALLNQILKIGFNLGLSHKFLNQIYERSLKLNTSYKDSKN